MSETPHYFIAIPLPNSLKNQLAKWQYDLKEIVPYKQWTNKGDLHITLKFLGPVEQEKLELLSETMKNLEKASGFPLNTKSIGTFGNPEKPRVLWAGIEKTDALLRLQQSVEHMASKIGFQKENRAYFPHITLAKKWNGEKENVDMESLLKQYSEQRKIMVDTVVINQIFPGESPKYQPIATYHLRGKVD